jgi:N-hydroxyarylamine O-acetyltransferase
MTFEAAKYLQHIGIKLAELPSVDFLRKLHSAHLLTIPFENLSIQINEKIILEPDDLYSKVVIRNRGGFCYELNFLFFTLLKSIGFDAKIISCRVFDDKSKYGAEFDHMAIIVKVDEKELLCDVGFGDSFIEPLEFVLDKAQKDRNYYYKISRYNDIYFLLSRSGDLSVWENLYLFSETSRTIDEYHAMCLYHQTSPESSFTRKRVCTKLTDNGRITLTDKKLIITEGINKNEFPFDGEDNFTIYLREKFNIEL